MGVQEKGNTPTDKEIEEAVWFYYNMGFSLIPLQGRSKIPNISHWKEYQTRCPTREEIQAWLDAGLFGGIGLIQGDVSGGIIVFDFDDPVIKDVLDIKPWEIWDMGGWIAKTGGEGRYHIYFKNSEKCQGIIKPVGYGIEYRGNGGYVAASPGIHPNGKQYSWVDKPHIPGMGNWKNHPLPDLIPIDANALWEKWIPKIEKHKGITHGDTQQEDTPLEGIPNCIKSILDGVKEGRRDDTAFAYASYLKQKGIPRDVIENSVQEWNKKNTPPLPENTIQVKVKSALHSEKTIGCNWWISRGLCQDPGNCPIRHQQRPYLNDSGRVIPIRMAENILAEYHFKTPRDTREIHIYRDGVYHPRAETFIEEYVQRLLGDKTTTYHKNEVIGCIRSATYLDPDRGNTKHMVNIENGILDLKTKALQPHTPGIFNVTQIPVTYDPGADCPQIKQFLEEILPPGDIPTVQELLGYCLLKDYCYQKAFMFIGDGSNGKSTLLQLLSAFLGKQNISSIELQEIMSNRFTRHQLHNKLANIYPDLPSKTLKQTGIFKALTGGDTLTADRKFKEPVTFVNHAKLIFSANELPPTLDDTTAFYRRWILINFPHTFEGANCDPHKLKKLTTQQELSGLLNYALEGLKQLQKNNGFSNSQTTEETHTQYTRLSNPIVYFLEECTTKDPEAVTPKDTIYNAYKVFCQENNLPIKAKNSFSLEIGKHIPGLVNERRTMDKGRVQCWKGIRLQNNGNNDTDNQPVRVCPDPSPLECQGVKANLYFKQSILGIDKVRKSRDNPDSPDSTTHKQVVHGSITLTHKSSGNNGGNGKKHTHASEYNPYSVLQALHESIKKHDAGEKGAHFLEIIADIRKYFPSDEKAYEFMEMVLDDPDGCIYKPREGYLQLTNKEGT